MDKLAKNIDDKLKIIEEKIEGYYDDFEKEIRNILHPGSVNDRNMSSNESAMTSMTDLFDKNHD